MPGKLHRESIRLRGFDYSKPALYFVTICARNKECLFGSIRNSVMTFSELGIAANDCWLEIPTHFPNTVLHEYVIMPNHIHGIIEIVDNKQNDDNDLKNGGSNDNDNNANNNVGAKKF